MKRLLLLLGVLVSLTAAQVVFAQTEGTITYEVKINMHRNIPKEREQMKAMIPEYRTSLDILAFNADASLHKPIIEDEADADMSGNGPRMIIRRPENETYIEQSTMRRVRLQDFMGKKYLIEDTLKVSPWKMGTEVKEVRGYKCRQATLSIEEPRKQTIVAWYTDQLRPFLGPEMFNTLPGAVLEVDINDGERIISAKSIELRSLKKSELKVPSGGAKITQEEYQKMMNEQMERMRANGGNIIIRN